MIRSLISSMPAKQRMVGTSIKKAIRVDRRCVRWWRTVLDQAEPTPT